MAERYTLEHAHSLVRRMSEAERRTVHLKPVFGWRELLAATFGSPPAILYEIRSNG